MTSVKFYCQRRVLGVWLVFLRGQVAWEVNVGRFFLQVVYRRYWRQFGLIGMGRL